MARRDRPLLILMDFNLPDIDGRILALQLKKQLGGQTARLGKTEVQLATRFGCSAFISKPFVPDEFLNTIKMLVPSLSEELK